MRAPKVVAKGVHLLAARIREIATEHRIPILEAPPLARALYQDVYKRQVADHLAYQAIVLPMTEVFD